MTDPADLRRSAYLAALSLRQTVDLMAEIGRRLERDRRELDARLRDLERLCPPTVGDLRIASDDRGALDCICRDAKYSGHECPMHAQAVLR